MMQFSFIEYLIIAVLSFSAWTGQEEGKIVQEPADCLDCHSDLVEFGQMHYPAEDACENCHEATGAIHPSADSAGFSLMDKIPALCFYCHEEPGQTEHAHKVVAEGDCMGCHNPHGSDEVSLLKMAEPDLCLSCHNRDYKSDSTETENIKRLVQGGSKAHSAIEFGGCSSCHRAHGSQYRSLLVEAYPAEDYLPARAENFQLCFLCHDSELLTAGETDRATRFRNGDQNLHWLHINGNKGRNCRLCHNLHGSAQAYLVEDRVHFGSWEMRMNYVPDEQGGSCLPGCHEKLSYKR
jgi:predicted CXXCH cytochrome family protein